MLRFGRLSRLAITVPLLLLAAGAACAGAIAPYSPNKAFIFVTGLGSFEAVGGQIRDGNRDSAVASVPGDIGYRNLVFAGVSAVPDPGSAAKDIARGDASLRFDLGAGADPDLLSISFSGTVSNSSAYVGASLADTATVALSAGTFFYLDPIFSGLPNGTLVGMLHLDGLRTAAAYETFSLKVEDAVTETPLLALMPGDAATDLPLYIGIGYSIRVNYVMAVPSGIDPPFELTLGGTIQSIPEPASAMLLLAGAAMALVRRR